MNIGITIGLSKDNEPLWINGIKLNILNLTKTLMCIPNTNVWILDSTNEVTDLTKVDWDHTKYKTYKLTDKMKELDVLIMLGTSLPLSFVEKLRNLNSKIKVVKYQCGNNYVIDMERSIFTDPNTEVNPSWSTSQDETWYVPQQGYQNHDYYQIAFRQGPGKVKPVPFVWDPEHLDNYIRDTKITGVEYSVKDSNQKQILVMEPNMNVVKYSMVPTMMVENLYRLHGDVFNKLIVAGGNKILKNNYYKKMIMEFDIVKSNPPKVKYIGRYPAPLLFAREADIIIAHQWENPLNYAYLDAMYYGYPFIHNADFIEDAGYYYSGFNIIDGSNILEQVLKSHDSQIDEYNSKNKKVLERYLSTNPEIVDTYRKLIENLFEPNKHQMSYEYNPKTNTYK